jgi:hypothetical protein
MRGLLDLLAALVIVFALAYGPVAGVIALAVIVPKVWKRVTRKKVPGCPQDGRPLTVPERERFGWITEGYGRSAREPGRQR